MQNDTTFKKAKTNQQNVVSVAAECKRRHLNFQDKLSLLKRNLNLISKIINTDKIIQDCLCLSLILFSVHTHLMFSSKGMVHNTNIQTRQQLTVQTID